MAAKKRSAKGASQRTSPRGSAAAKPSKKRKAKATAKKALSAKPSPSKAAAKPAKARALPRKAVKKASPSAGAAKTRGAAEPEASAGLVPGDRAPRFELTDQRGVVVSSESLAGSPYVVYFYPKDDTPGCTTEACGFRDAFPDFEHAGVRVLGVSPDSVASHQRFVGKYSLPFTLLSDTEHELATHYGVWALKKNYGREYMGIVRSTFVVDASGVVRNVWRGVRVNGHVSEVQAAVAQLA